MREILTKCRFFSISNAIAVRVIRQLDATLMVIIVKSKKIVIKVVRAAMPNETPIFAAVYAKNTTIEYVVQQKSHKNEIV